MRQFVGPLIIIILTLAFSIIWNRRLIIRLRKNGGAAPATHLALSTGIMSYYLSYKYVVNGKEFGRRQRITKDKFELLRLEEQPVTVTYQLRKPATSRLLDYATMLEERDVMLYLIFFSVCLIIAIL